MKPQGKCGSKSEFLGVKIIEGTGILVILVREVKAELWNLLLHRFSEFCQKNRQPD